MILLVLQELAAGAAPCPCTAPCTTHGCRALQHGHLGGEKPSARCLQGCPQLHSPPAPQLPSQSPQLHPSSTRFSMRMWWTRAGMEVGMSQSPHLSPVASAPPRASTVWQLSDLATPAVPGLASMGKHIPLGLGEVWPRRRDAGPFCQCLLHFPQRGKAPLAGTQWGPSMQQEASPNHLWGHCLCPSSVLRPAPAKMRVRKRKCHLLPGTTSVRKCTK